MIPRFSIFTLLAATAYIALNVAAYTQPHGRLPIAAMICDVVLCLTLVAIATTRQPLANVIFARGVLLGVLITCLLVATVPGMPWESPERVWKRLTIGGTLRMRRSALRAEQIECDAMKRFVVVSGGMLGGSMALWHYGKLVRRARGQTP